MKKTVAAAFMLAAVAGTAGITPAAGTEWMLLDENISTAFYLKSGATGPVGGIVRITVRTLYTDEGRADALEVLSPASRYEHLSETHYVYDLDCTRQMSRLLRATHLDDGGDQISTQDLSSVTPWEAIPPDSRLELVTDEVCRPPSAPAAR